MKIIITGAGKVGETLAEHLAAEGHEITVVDSDPEVLRVVGERLDLMTVEGGCASFNVLMEAGADKAE